MIFQPTKDETNGSRDHNNIVFWKRYDLLLFERMCVFERMRFRFYAVYMFIGELPWKPELKLFWRFPCFECITFTQASHLIILLVVPLGLLYYRDSISKSHILFIWRFAIVNWRTVERSCVNVKYCLTIPLWQARASNIYAILTINSKVEQNKSEVTCNNCTLFNFNHTLFYSKGWC